MSYETPECPYYQYLTLKFSIETAVNDSFSVQEISDAIEDVESVLMRGLGVNRCCVVTEHMSITR